MEIDAELAAEFAQLGVQVEVTSRQEEAFRVWDVNWQSVLLFLDCETQWRAVATMAGLIFLGIDYTAVHALLDLKRGRRRYLAGAERLLQDLRVMEREALKVFVEVRG
ncbi:DUF1799 domain-containing protein [Mesorhizobium sp. ES1-1]|uniref:DUF1799 domain-containing protein n=1 Tax=Mesorhizobium sp. ES1-1 TaxID=2876629 RepID=UPI001CCFCBA7|nr:DUF1799 domain-containing protein [Mesorhizobium sp. ES1-1]MBZ9678892.1 DUF1799 domain-containing protein [Mesorhizobium sp. ES1-1]